MNHAQIAAEALRFRLAMVRRPVMDDLEWDLDAMAAASVTAAEPEVDGAIRQIATAWIRSGFDPNDLTKPWIGSRIERLFSQRPDLIDALDAIVRAATRVQAA